MTHKLADRFQVLGELGQGGMGTVYRVIDTLGTDEELALKLLRRPADVVPEGAGVSSDKRALDQRLRFKEEFRVMTRLKHPNTIAVQDYGQLDDGTQFITMEVVPGVELADLVAEGPMPLDRVYPLLIQLLQALEFIHSRLLVHRDIKSQNIRVRPDGTLKLMDFGLMTPLGQHARGGVLTGSPGYVAPEVVRGGVIDAGSDLYGVGCLAYELLTGRLPFLGRVIEVVRAHATEAPMPLRQLRPGVPPRLEQIVMRLLAKDQGQRYAQASDVITDLAQIAGIEVVRQNIEQKRSYLTAGLLVGRGPEMKVLGDALAKMRTGQGGAIFVGAPAGVGKSRLMEEFSLQAKLDEVYILNGAGHEDGLAPYELAAASLRPLLAITPAAVLERLGPRLHRLFPDLAGRGIPAEPPLEPDLEKVRLNETVAAWLRAVAETTSLAWVVDNLHWADLSSLELLNHCIRQSSGMRVLVLAGLRGDEAPGGHPIWFTPDEGATVHLRLDALDRSQMRELLAGMLHSYELEDAAAQSLYDVTGGNPYFLTEAVRYLMEEGLLIRREGVWRFPADASHLDLLESAEKTLLRRLAHLSEGARGLAGVAAVIGRHAQRDMLLALAHVDEEAFFDLLDELVEGQFLMREGDRLSFTHDRTRHVLYQDLAVERRRTLHHEAAIFLDANHDREQPAMVIELAHHHSRGREPVMAFYFLRLAGDQAEAAGAEATALDYRQQADRVLDTLDLGPEKPWTQLDLWWEIGFGSFVLHPGAAIAALSRMKAMLEAHPELDPEHQRLVAACNILANAYGFAGQPTQGLATLDAAERALPGEATLLHGAMAVVRCASLIPAGRYDEVLASARQGEAVLWARPLDDDDPPPVFPARVGALIAQNAVCFQGLRPDEDLRDRALVAALAIGDEEPFTAHQFFGIWYAWTGRHAQALDYIGNALQKCRKIGAPPYLWTLYLQPLLALQRGDPEAALGLIQHAARYPHVAQNAFALQLITILKGEVLLALGDPAGAADTFDEAEAAGRAGGLALVTMRALLGKAQLFAKQGQLATARAAAGEVLQTAATGPARNPLHEALARRQLGEISLREGRLDLAAEQFAAALAIVERPDQANILEQARTHLVIGRLAQLRGEPDQAAVSLQAARSRYREIQNVYGLALVEQAHEAPLGPGEPVRIVEPATDEGLRLRMAGMMKNLGM
ncbi:MAG: hypothetical protein JWM80_6145 [Cyanobacteria bacterium RYN_339]|nr:hypothetical protein [Cyanobacteria bacterium RYN_339]